MQTEHPKRAAEYVTRLVTEVADFLSGYGELNRPPTDVSPQPCDQADGTVPVEDGNTSHDNPFADPWYVDYSPYTMMFIGFIDVRTPTRFADVGGRLRDHCTVLEWRVQEAVLEPQGPGDEARLVFESSVAGYGVRIVNVPTAAAPLRIGIFASSPCLRHPDAVTE